MFPSCGLVDRVSCHLQERSSRSRDTGAHNGRAPLRLPSLVMGDREVCAPTVWASSHWSACLEVGGEPSPCSFGNADQQCRCIVAYPRLRVFPLAWFSVMPGLMTSHLTVCWFSVVTLDHVTWVTGQSRHSYLEVCGQWCAYLSVATHGIRHTRPER